jgi:hypothetical protein
LNIAERAAQLCLPTAKPLGERAQELLSDKRPNVRRCAIGATAMCLKDGAAKRLREMLLVEDDKSVRMTVVEWLGYYAFEDSLAAIDEVRKAHISDKDFVWQCDESKRRIMGRILERSKPK